MNNSSEHTIDFLEHAVETTSWDIQKNLDEKLNQVTNHKLLEIIEKVFNRYDQKNENIVIENLVIDLEFVNYSNLENDYVKKFEENFEKVMARHKRDRENEFKTTQSLKSKLNEVMLYLKFGISAQNNNQDIESYLRKQIIKLMSHQPLVFELLIRKILKSKTLSSRFNIIFPLKSAQINALLTQIEQAYSDSGKDYLKKNEQNFEKAIVHQKVNKKNEFKTTLNPESEPNEVIRHLKFGINSEHNIQDIELDFRKQLIQLMSHQPLVFEAMIKKILKSKTLSSRFIILFSLKPAQINELLTQIEQTYSDLDLGKDYLKKIEQNFEKAMVHHKINKKNEFKTRLSLESELNEVINYLKFGINPEHTIQNIELNFRKQLLKLMSHKPLVFEVLMRKILKSKTLSSHFTKVLALKPDQIKVLRSQIDQTYFELENLTSKLAQRVKVESKRSFKEKDSRKGSNLLDEPETLKLSAIRSKFKKVIKGIKRKEKSKRSLFKSKVNHREIILELFNELFRLDNPKQLLELYSNKELLILVKQLANNQHAITNIKHLLKHARTNRTFGKHRLSKKKMKSQIWEVVLKSMMLRIEEPSQLMIYQLFQIKKELHQAIYSRILNSWFTALVSEFDKNKPEDFDIINYEKLIVLNGFISRLDNQMFNDRIALEKGSAQLTVEDHSHKNLLKDKKHFFENNEDDFDVNKNKAKTELNDMADNKIEQKLDVLQELNSALEKDSILKEQKIDEGFDKSTRPIKSKNSSKDSVTVDSLQNSKNSNSKELIKKNLENSKEQEDLRMKVENILELISKENMLIEKVYISNAGLVILHPYLNRYFEEIGLITSGKFKSDEDKEMAALKIHHLVHNRTDYNESELILNKILCGLDPEHLIETNFEMSPRELEIEEQMMNAVIGNWAALGNTSIDGFRQSFIQRAGILNKTNETFQLEVESKAYDILMNRLPWSIKMIKSGWMTSLINVVWER